MPNPIYPNIFYVYGYLRSKDSKTGSKGTFYYVGKGSNGRAYAPHGKVPVPKNKKDDIIFFVTCISEYGAFYIEKFFIKCYGRKDKGTGFLLNRTDGGEGTSGMASVKDKEGNTFSIPSDDQRLLNGEFVHVSTGRKHLQHEIDKMRERQLGENHPKFSGYYHIPQFGKFASSYALENEGINNVTMVKYCKKNTTVISKNSYDCSKFLKNHFGPEIIGKTLKDIGFWFESLSD